MSVNKVKIFKNRFISLVTDDIKRWMEAEDQYDISLIVIDRHVLYGGVGPKEHIAYEATVVYVEYGEKNG